MLPTALAGSTHCVGSSTGAAELKGSTLVARHGKGTYVFTALAFFRQLQAGVPGAYRLFVNLLTHGR